jgi:hypothetical protein
MLVVKALDTSRLVKKPVTITRDGKTFQQHRWVRPGIDEPKPTNMKILTGEYPKNERNNAPENDVVKRLFDPNNKKDCPRKDMVQPTGDIDELYKMAEAVRGDFRAVMEKLKDELGASELLSRPTLKNRERVKEKMAEDGATDASMIYDIDGHTLVFDNLEGIGKALDYFMKDPRVIRIKNYYATPTLAGYRGVNINVKLPNGMISEIQLNTKAMIEAKEKYGHLFYEITREAEGQIPPPPPPAPYHYAILAQKRIYQFAWEVSSGHRDAANLSASFLDISLPFWKMSANILESHGSSWLSERTLKRFQDFGSLANGVSSSSKNLNESKSGESIAKSSISDKYIVDHADMQHAKEKRGFISKAINRAKLVKKPILVTRMGKVYRAEKWVRPDKDNKPVKTKNNFKSKEFAEKLLDGEVPLPDGMYVHGRRPGKEYGNDEWPTLFSTNIDTAKSYAGNGGSVWLAKPSAHATVADFFNEHSEDMNRFIEKLHGIWELYKKDELNQEDRDLIETIYNDISAATDEDEVSFDTFEREVRQAFAPRDIVDTAGAYDNPDWWALLKFYNEDGGPDWIITPNGAVMMPGRKDAIESYNLTEQANRTRKALPEAGDTEYSHKTPPKGYPEEKKEYADPNNYKYPLDTEEHVLAAMAYFSMPRNYSKYDPDQRRAIWNRIMRAAKKYHIEIAEKDKFVKGQKYVVKAMTGDHFEKAKITPGLVPIQQTVHRGGSVFSMRVWVRQDEENKQQGELFTDDDYSQSGITNIVKNLTAGTAIRYKSENGYKTSKILKVSDGVVDLENGEHAPLESIDEIFPVEAAEAIHRLISSAGPENRAAITASLMGVNFGQASMPEYEFTPKVVELIKGKTGLDYRDVIPSRISLVTEKNILDKKRPSWIPEIQDYAFRVQQYRVEAIKLDDNSYAINTSNGYAVVNLDVLAATQDYYLKRAKALHRQWYEEKIKEFKEYASRLKMPRLTVISDKRVTTRNILLAETFLNLRGNERFKPVTDAIKDLKQKLDDMNIQLEENYSVFSKGRETAYGDKGTKPDLLDQYGVLVKRQNGDAITQKEIDDIRKALDDVYAVFGNRASMARKFGLKISHSGQVLMHARNASGIFIPNYHAIGVTFKAGRDLGGMTLAHEWAHFMDHYLALQTGRYQFASDNWSSLPGQIARTFREKMMRPQTSIYINRTCECFARALEEYYMLKNGKLNLLFDKNKSIYVQEETYKSKILPLVERFFAENEELLKSFRLLDD